MYHLLDGPARFAQLSRRMPEAGRQTLVSQLRALEHAGAVRRTVLGGIPPRVQYALTADGRETEPILRRLHDWVQWCSDRVDGDVDWLVCLGGRWKVRLLLALSDGPKRFSEIQRLVPGISNQVLARELRELTALGFVAKDGGYTLTDVGCETTPVIRQLHAWGRWMCEQTGTDFDWPLDIPAEPRVA
jgi:DNA-binding HxlR family transcriptional regulator